MRAGMVDRFELRVKELNPQLRQITYEMSDLYRWMDQMVGHTFPPLPLSESPL